MQVTLIYSGDDVRVHKAGCRDVDKDKRRADTVYNMEANSFQDVANEFYSDFINEGSMTTDQALNYCNFAPCTAGLSK